MLEIEPTGHTETVAILEVRYGDSEYSFEWDVCWWHEASKKMIAWEESNLKLGNESRWWAKRPKVGDTNYMVQELVLKGLKYGSANG